MNIERGGILSYLWGRCDGIGDREESRDSVEAAPATEAINEIGIVAGPVFIVPSNWFS